MTTCSAISKDKVVIMTTLIFQWLGWSIPPPPLCPSSPICMPPNNKSQVLCRHLVVFCCGLVSVDFTLIVQVYTAGPVFCLLLWVSSDYAQPISLIPESWFLIPEVTCPVIGRAQPELTLSKRLKRGPGPNASYYYPSGSEATLKNISKSILWIYCII